MRGKATIVVVLWSVLLAAVTLAVLNHSPVQRACDAVANCWYKRNNLAGGISERDCRFVYTKCGWDFCLTFPTLQYNIVRERGNAR